MLRFMAGVASALMLVAAGFFIWKSRAQSETVIPPAPAPAALLTPLKSATLPTPPAASEKSKEEKRFARADRDDDGRITRDELMAPRQKAFAKLDTSGDGRLSFEEWAVTTGNRFKGADDDGDGILTAEEYATTQPKPAPRRKCAC